MRQPDYLYNLLPRFNRTRDIGEGRPLQALFTLLQAQYDLIEDDIGTLYTNWFVESCEDWVLPYIAELIGGAGIAPLTQPGLDGRRLVANLTGYRRRNGLAGTLEQVIEDVTGWPACVREWRDTAAMTETVRRIGQAGGFTDVRRLPPQAERGDPFGGLRRNAAVRPDGMGPGRVAVHLWRNSLFAAEEAGGWASEEGRHFVHPLGIDTPLFQRSLRPQGLGVRTDQARFPSRCRDLGGTGTPAFALRIVPAGGGAPVEVPADRILLSDLSAWQAPDAAQSGCRAVLDPRRGRVLLPAPEDKGARIETDHVYGGPAAIGGGAYVRPRPAQDEELPAAALVASAGQGPGIVASPGDGFAAWQRGGGDGVIEFADSAVYLPASKRGDWSLSFDGPPSTLVLRAGEGRRPCLAGGLRIKARQPGHRLILDGMTIGGCLHLDGPITLDLRHCTLVAGHRRVALSGEKPAAGGRSVRIDSSIVGPIRLAGGEDHLDIQDSIVDGGGLWAITGAAQSRPDRDHGPSAAIRRSTLCGGVAVAALDARDALFAQPVMVASKQGALSFCGLPAASRTPPQTHCQGLPDRDNALFRSLRHGDPDYCRLAPWAEDSLRLGAGDGGEIGVFNHLSEHHRRRRLHEVLDEYFPLGLGPVVIEVS